MKKLFAFFTLLAAQWASAQCYNPCDEWYGCCFQCGSCRPGFYVGAHFGHAWIQTPKLGRILIDVEGELRCSEIQGQRGDFSWGVFGGYHACFWLPGFYAGIEGGYHDNGSSTFFAQEDFNIAPSFSFSEAFKCCKISSHDWDISATFDYVFLCCFDLFFKIGGAEVCERFTTQKLLENEKSSSKITLKQWAPVINTGFGYCIYDFLRVTISYRGVICKNHSRLNKNIHLDEECVTLPQITLDSCSSVHSAYGGLTFTF